MLNGAILIKDGIIEEILPYEEINLDILIQEYIVEDLGNLCVFPGLIDLNVVFNSDGASIVTLQALSGGVTTIATTDFIEGDLYTDIAKIAVLHDDNLSEIQQVQESDIFAFKTYLVPQGPGSNILSNISTAIKNISKVPLIIHPELATPANMMLSTPFRQIEPERRTFMKIIIEEKNIIASSFKLNSSDEDEVEEEEEENKEKEGDDDYDFSDSCSEELNPEIQINDFSVQENEIIHIATEFDNMRLAVPNKEKDKKRVSLPNLLEPVEKININSPRHHSVQCIGSNRPIPIQDIPFIAKGVNVQEAYHNHIMNFPPE